MHPVVVGEHAGGGTNLSTHVADGGHPCTLPAAAAQVGTLVS